MQPCNLRFSDGKISFNSFINTLLVNRSKMDFVQPIKCNFTFLRAIGLSPRPQDSSFYIFYGILFNLGSSIIFMIPLLHEAVLTDDITKRSRMIVFLLLEVTYLAKVLILILKSSAIEKLVHEITKIDYQPVTTADKRILQRGISRFKFWIKAYFSVLGVVLMSMFLTFLGPVLTVQLPVGQWFFGLDWQHNTAIYIAITLFYLSFITVRALFHNLFNLFSFYFIYFAVIHKKMICARLAKLNGPLYRVNFVKIVKTDQTLNQVLEDIEKLFSFAIFVLLSMMSFVICLMSYRLSKVGFPDFIFVVLFLFLTVLQLFMPCYIGHELMCANQNIGFSIYSSNWLSVKSRQRKDIIIGIMKSAQPRAFIANHWFILWLPTVTAVSVTI
jgi:7tm Odorant receptor